MWDDSGLIEGEEWFCGNLVDDTLTERRFLTRNFTQRRERDIYLWTYRYSYISVSVDFNQTGKLT